LNAYAQLQSDVAGIYEATVVHAGQATEELVPGTAATHTSQNITIRFVEGPLVDTERSINNEFAPVTVGDTIYVQHIVDIEGTEYLYVYEIQRTTGMWMLCGLFAAILIMFGGMQGVRALLALALGFAAIVYVLVPSLLAGYSPVLMSIVVATGVLFLALVMTHGFNRGSLIAFLGTTLAVCVTGVLAVYSIRLVHLTGVPSETEWYVALNVGHHIDLLGLLLGGIIIGVLGALDDIAITQVATVRELYSVDAHMRPWDVYTRAMRVGKDHVGALVNTLALAYAGAALPLLLLFSAGSGSGVPFVNLEVFATEIVRIIVSSIGLILTVPITTVLAAYVMRGHVADVPPDLHAHVH
jgi:uncharacterized membrane protein